MYSPFWKYWNVKERYFYLLFTTIAHLNIMCPATKGAMLWDCVIHLLTSLPNVFSV